METLAFNLRTGRVRREIVSGEAYLVAPMTIIVSGVLPGSDGPLYYPPDEVAADVGVWNGTPIVVYHPYQNGRNVSASEPGVLDSQGVGFLRNDRYRNGKRQADGWFHVEDTRRVDPRVLEALEEGRPIELSTGLFVDKEPATNGATCPKGRPYQATARNYRPDHLAVLPDQVGACSIEDGCGVLVNHRGGRASQGGWTPVPGGGRHAVRAKPRTRRPVRNESPLEGLKAAAKKIKETPGAMPGYGQTYWNDDLKEVWYVGGDGDTKEFYKSCKRLLEAVPGVKSVRYEAESFPKKGAGYVLVRNEQPSDELDMDPEKACQILRDGAVHGKELTEAQRGMFGALCGQREKPMTNRWRPIAEAFRPAPVSNACCKGCEHGTGCKGECPGGAPAQNEGTSMGKDAWIAGPATPAAAEASDEETCPECGRPKGECDCGWEQVA